jgi:hypothetical protein
MYNCHVQIVYKAYYDLYLDIEEKIVFNSWNANNDFLRNCNYIIALIYCDTYMFHSQYSFSLKVKLELANWWVDYY